MYILKMVIGGIIVQMVHGIEIIRAKITKKGLIAMRLQTTLDYLKNQFYEAGEEWEKTNDDNLLKELHALVSAITTIEDFLYERRITVITDAINNR